MPNLKQAAAALEEMADLLGLTEKSIASVARRFNRELKALVTDAWNGSGTITRDMRQLVKQYVEDAYIEGLKAGNIPADEMTVDDAQMVDELNLTQQDYVKDFASAVKQAQTEAMPQIPPPDVTAKELRAQFQDALKRFDDAMREGAK